MIKLKLEDLDMLDDILPGGEKKVEAPAPSVRTARLATLLYQSTWESDGAFTNLPENIRTELAREARAVADLLDPPDKNG